MRLTYFAVLACVVALAACSPKPNPPALSDEANAQFLADNAKKEGVISVPGIQYEVLKKGSGEEIELQDCVAVNYTGSLTDGKVFDKTEPGKPITLPVNRLIPGWVEALQMMHGGDKWRIVIPSGLAYGKKGAGNGVIPPNQTLVFELEIVKVFGQFNGSCAA